MTQQMQSSFGPQQFPDHLGIERWKFDRAVDMGLIPAPDRARGRWSRTVVEEVADRLDVILADVGTVPDVGATRAAEYLTDRLGVHVEPDAVTELARQGVVRTVGDYKGHLIYDGRDVEAVTDVDTVREAGRIGQQLMRAAVADRLGVRDVDVQHLHRAGYLTPCRYVLGSHRRSRRAAPTVPLYRLGDVLALLNREDIDWPTVRAAVGPQRRSPFAALPDAPELS